MSNQEKKKKTGRTFTGTVVSVKMDKTAVVKIDRVKKHPVYLKRFKVSRKYKVHDPKNQCQLGEQVSFLETRPLSKDKRWILIKPSGAGLTGRPAKQE
ncbi:MAG: 30S ribosomal protein S17 [bacterium]